VPGDHRGSRTRRVRARAPIPHPSGPVLMTDTGHSHCE
jgi:hypothetical protein